MGGSGETPSPAGEGAERLLEDAVGFAGICALGCRWQELIPVPDGKTEMWGDPGSTRPGISPSRELKKNASSPGFHVKFKLFGARAV